MYPTRYPVLRVSGLPDAAESIAAIDDDRELVGPTEATRGDDLHFRKRYAAKAPRLFSK